MPEERLEPLADELSGILAWIEQLNEVDTDGVEPMTSAVAAKLPMREDVVTDGGDPARDPRQRAEGATAASSSCRRWSNERRSTGLTLKDALDGLKRAKASPPSS